jgi:YD repeat-containing protein
MVVVFCVVCPILLRIQQPPVEGCLVDLDLSVVGLAGATHLRLTDTAGAFPDDGDSFDLDAVAVINGEAGGGRITGKVFPNPARSTVAIVPPEGAGFRVYDLLGRLVLRKDAAGRETRYTYTALGALQERTVGGLKEQWSHRPNHLIRLCPRSYAR